MSKPTTEWLLHRIDVLADERADRDATIRRLRREVREVRELRKMLRRYSYHAAMCPTCPVRVEDLERLAPKRPAKKRRR